jgi:predicted ATPase
LSYASALTFAARVYQGRRDLEKVRLVAGELVSLSRERGFSYYEAQGLIHQGWTLVLIGEDQAGCSQLVEGYTALERTGTVLGLRGALVQLAEAWQKLGFVDKASWAVDRAHNQEHGRGTHCWEAEIARLRAELIGEGRDQDPHAARSAYRMALEVARRQGARSLELRSALSYAKASLSQGQSGEARELLEQIVSAFTEGTDTVELREAQRVLNL